MKYYSEVTKKFYDNEKACREEEDKVTREESQKTAARKAAADKVNAAFEAYQKAAKAYRAALSDFCSKYGTFHKTYTNNELKDELEDWIAMINML